MACGRSRPAPDRDGDDLHDPGLEQPLDPLADGGLGQPHRLADGRVGAAPVGLQLLDDPLGRLVEREVRPSGRGRAGHGPSLTARGGPWQAARSTESVVSAASAHGNRRADYRDLLIRNVTD
jgi:hypothetical protein